MAFIGEKSRLPWNHSFRYHVSEGGWSRSSVLRLALFSRLLFLFCLFLLCGFWDSGDRPFCICHGDIARIMCCAGWTCAMHRYKQPIGCIRQVFSFFFVLYLAALAQARHPASTSQHSSSERRPNDRTQGTSDLCVQRRGFIQTTIRV
ncbi:hypothetical protein B0I35DRAFT_231609 [Stachybotrys elegans]|uniref:Uncharacterized protein n=1 Tax=Stachybotrys elegans TaxID=80388 RepID=A0A8K0ST88_9HYPO|nr:hypothetical protein B0I35DRAFT_231609 [Stachybotrys elegans]